LWNFKDIERRKYGTNNVATEVGEASEPEDQDQCGRDPREV
jgi:hypothetical protein